MWPGRRRFGFESLAVPEVHGSHFYRSYLIVNKDSPYHRLEDLRGRTFAFTDPDSNTGRLVPTYWLAEMHERPETFFSRIVYTYSHDNSIMAVARNLVDGATVDGLIWEFYQEKNPSLYFQNPDHQKIRALRHSAPGGLPEPPGAESKSASGRFCSPCTRTRKGKKILAELMIDRFIPPQEEWYENLRQMYQQLAARKDKPHAP